MTGSHLLCLHQISICRLAQRRGCPSAQGFLEPGYRSIVAFLERNVILHNFVDVDARDTLQGAHPK